MYSSISEQEVMMARTSGRAALHLSEEQKTMLSGLARSRTAAVREFERAKVLLAYAEGQSPTEIQRLVGVSRPTIYKCIDKALAAGVSTGLWGHYPRPYAPEISDEENAKVRGRVHVKGHVKILEKTLIEGYLTIDDIASIYSLGMGYAKL